MLSALIRSRFYVVVLMLSSTFALSFTGLLFYALLFIIEGSGSKAYRPPFWVLSSASLVGGLLFFLCLHFAISNNLCGFWNVLCRGFNQLGDVFQELIEFRCGHWIHFLTSFRKRLLPLPYTYIILWAYTYINRQGLQKCTPIFVQYYGCTLIDFSVII